MVVEFVVCLILKFYQLNPFWSVYIIDVQSASYLCTIPHCHYNNKVNHILHNIYIYIPIYHCRLCIIDYNQSVWNLKAALISYLLILFTHCKQFCLEYDLIHYKLNYFGSLCLSPTVTLCSISSTMRMFVTTIYQHGYMFIIIDRQ